MLFLNQKKRKITQATTTERKKRSLTPPREEGEEPEYKRFKIVLEEEQYLWSLPEGMAKYGNEQFEQFIPDKEVKL